jgi:hypothetical protein
MNPQHPATHLLLHRLQHEQLDREHHHRHRASLRAAGYEMGGIRTTVTSVLGALGRRSRTVAPVPRTFWDDLGLRPR